MVGVFSITPTPPLHSYRPPTFLPRLPQVSIAAVAVIMLLLAHAAIVPPASAATGSIPESTSSKFRSAPEEISQLPKRQYAVGAATTRFRRHLLVSGGADGDQAARDLVGSSPPKCIKKCGACTPCKSVLVPIHTSNFPATPAEYYPEAWRCQCRGRIYNP